jgi:hypothetical protein
VIDLLTTALHEIGKLATAATSSTAADAISVIRAIYDAVKRADSHEITSSAAKAEIQKLLGKIADNDAAADAALKDKFR